MSNSSFVATWRTMATISLVIAWLLVFFMQIFLYTSAAEVIGYVGLFVLLAFIFLKWIRSTASPIVLFGGMLVIAIALGLVPYNIRMHDWALFFSASAKDPQVTYFRDPYLSLPGIFWTAFFPVMHFVLMYLISRIRIATAVQGPGTANT